MTAAVPGYRPQRLTVTPAAASVQQDVALQIDADSCTAPGYARPYAYRESFDASSGGWTSSSTVSWAWGKPTSGPGAAHSGTRVWATNLAGNYGTGENGDLISPVIDLPRYAGERPVLVWSQWLKTIASGRQWPQRRPLSSGGQRHRPGQRRRRHHVGDRLRAYGGRHRIAWTEKFVVLSEAYAVPGFRVRFRFQEAPGERPTSAGTSMTWASPRFGSTRRWSTRRTSRAAAGVTPAVAPTARGRWGTPPPAPGAAHSGTQAWATNLAGDYSGSEDSALTSPAIDLSAYRGAWPVVSWWQWLQTEGGNDQASLEVTADGTAWTRVYGLASGNVDLAWAQKSLTLSASYASNRFQMRFRFASNGCDFWGCHFVWPGFYVDDITSRPVPSPASLPRRAPRWIRDPVRQQCMAK